jgi:lycopene cyclase domain-containing protein
MHRYLYLILDLLTLSYPLIRSFEDRVAYSKQWYALFPGILAGMTVFIPWDIWFTAAGYWGFNDHYLIGVRILHLPLEEWLFFIFVPYSSIFIYEVMNYFVKKDVLGPVKNALGMVLGLFSAGIAVTYYDRWYTVTAFGLLAALLFLHVFVLRSKWLGRFFLGYLVILVPFLLVNGVLTGTGIPEQVVWYNDAENLGIRMGTIPVEDAFYGMGLMMIVVSVMEWLRGRRAANSV